MRTFSDLFKGSVKVYEQKGVPLALKNIAVDVHTSERVRIGQANFGIEHGRETLYSKPLQD